MSSVDFNLRSSTSSSLVGKILEQGQRLRNSMVQTILNNDPFNKEIASNNMIKIQTEHMDCDCKENKTDKDRNKGITGCNCNKKTFDSYSQDDFFDEEKALQALGIKPYKNSSVSISCKSRFCSCNICKEYEKIPATSELVYNNTTDTVKLKVKTGSTSTKSVSVDVQTEPKLKNNIEHSPALKAVKTTFQENQSLLKYVDSLKVIICSLRFNTAGRRKVMSNNDKFSYFGSNTYFIEYTLPEILIKNIQKTKAKVNTGLNPANKIRFCSKRSQNEVILFNQQSIHSISNIDLLDLSSINIEFSIGCRAMKQRLPEPIGKAYFNLAAIITNHLFSSAQELVIMSEKAPVVLGNLKVSLQFGCDKLHFGKEFIDAINYYKGNSATSVSEFMFKSLETEHNSMFNNLTKNTSAYFITNCNQNANEISTIEKPVQETQTEKSIKITNSKPIIDDTTSLLYSFVYLSEAKILSQPVDSYLLCYGLNRDDNITSQIIYNSCNPVFNFYQSTPLLYDEHFLSKLLDQFFSVEVWEKRSGCDTLIGITRLSLHRFYVIYRNASVVSHLLQNKHPVIGIDWWEPITNPVTQNSVGQLKAVVALGTETQINALKQNLETKTFIENKTVNFSTQIRPVPEPIIEVDECQSDHRIIEQSVSQRTVYTEPLVSDKYVQTPEVEITASNTNLNQVKKTADAATQSDLLKMDSDNVNNVATSGQEFLSSFVEQILSSKELTNKNIYVENSTNTDDIQDNIREINKGSDMINSNNLASVSSNKSLRNTSDLLETLQKALGDNKISDNNIKPKDFSFEKFKAHIVIDSALHLPSRKKCKSKRNKLKGMKHNEEILPSTYVTFKSDNDREMVVTSVIPKSTSPHWDFRHDVQLPCELLFNNQKRLIFKVWRRASATTLQPNFQTDIVLGFAALDLTVLLSGLPTVQGWFNIVDFSSKCNGQIRIHVTPLENLSKFQKYKITCSPEKPFTKNFESLSVQENGQIDEIQPELFNRALKRKFTELEEITQRLKQRLETVTKDDSDMSGDDFADEFERDLNTECVETEKLTFDNEIHVLSISEDNSGVWDIESDIRILDIMNKNKQDEVTQKPIIEDNIINNYSQNENEKITDLTSHLTEGKLRIDNLLEKLSLITDNETTDTTIFNNRYVSGCSIDKIESPSKETNSLLKQFNLMGKNLDPDLIFNPVLFQQMFNSSSNETPRSDDIKHVHSTTLQSLVDSSSSSSSVESSIDTNVSRQAPDGAGFSDSRLK